MIGKIIKELRQTQDLTLNELSAKSGVSAATISRLERGDFNTSFANVSKVVSALGCRLNIKSEEQIGVPSH